MLSRRLIAVVTVLLLAVGALPGSTERYVYSRRVTAEGTQHLETIETLEINLDTGQPVVVRRRIERIDKQRHLAMLQAQKAGLLAEAAALQARIDNLTAVPD